MIMTTHILLLPRKKSPGIDVLQTCSCSADPIYPRVHDLTDAHDKKQGGFYLLNRQSDIQDWMRWRISQGQRRQRKGGWVQ